MFGRSSADKRAKNRLFMDKYNFHMYKFSADDLLSEQLPPHKVRDLKRRSRVIMESNNRMLHVVEDLLGISNEILESLSDSSKEIFSPDNHKSILLVS